MSKRGGEATKPLFHSVLPFEKSREHAGIPNPDTPYGTAIDADQARGGARGFNGAAVLWQSHGVSG